MKFASALVAAFGIVIVASVAITSPVVQAAPTPQACPDYLNHDFRKLHSSETVNICKLYAGKPLLIVNTASHCGFTPQFKGLEAVNKKYKDQGLVMVGFASDDFNQEDKDEGKAAEICEQNFGVTFLMLSPTHVKGTEANPVFAELAKQKQAPAWNFNKYFVQADGKVQTYFASPVTPESAQFTGAVEGLLKK
ncbi:MAG: glutathione peroxidase [Pseudomonadota bacterium]